MTRIEVTPTKVTTTPTTRPAIFNGLSWRKLLDGEEAVVLITIGGAGDGGDGSGGGGGGGDGGGDDGGGDGDGGGGALTKNPTTSVVLVSSVKPDVDSCARSPLPLAAAFSVFPVAFARLKSKKDTVNATFTDACARVLINNTPLG